jgi:hypothetical protein
VSDSPMGSSPAAVSGNVMAAAATAQRTARFLKTHESEVT